MDEPNRNRVTSRFSEILKSGEPISYLENEVRRKDGHVVTLESRGTPIINENGRRIGYRGIDRDITERKHAEQKLRQSEERFKGAFHNSPIGIALVSPEGGFLQVNSQLCDTLGYREKELLTLRFQDLTYPDDLEADLAQVLQMLSGDINSYTMEKRYVHKNGQVIWALLSVGLVRDQEGRPFHFVSQIKDITERKNAELEQNKLWRAVENSPLCIVITDIHGTIEYVNPAFSVITGFTFEEVVGENPRILQSGKHDAAFYADLWQTIAAGKTWHGEMCNRKKNGDLLWEQVAISPVKDNAGNVVNFVAVKQDVSDRKSLEQLKEDIDRIMRHDLKTPLNAIIGIPQILEMEDNLTGEQREYIGMIKTAGRRMLEMIDSSLDIYKMENGAYRYDPAPVDVTPVIQRIMDETQSLASAKNSDLRFEDECGGRPVMVLGEKPLLLSMLSNLAVNALEASPPNESVVIAARDLDDGVEIAVHNKGAVPEAVRKDFFQKYTTHGKKKGTGLGTYSAKLIAEKMNGRIRMATSEKTGTVVSVVLPKA